MSNLVSITRLALLTLAVSTGLAAQEGWEGALKFGGGPTTGPAKTVTGNSGFSFAPTLEAAYHFNKTSSWVFGVGYRFLPGDIYASRTFIAPPAVVTRTATNFNAWTASVNAARAWALANPGPQEMTLRKPDAKGMEFTSLYRHTFNEDLFVQGGIRLGLYKVSVRDTGTRFNYSFTEASGTFGTPNWVNASLVTPIITTLAIETEKKTASFGLMAGIGYRLTENFSIEANAFTIRLGDPLGSTNTSLATELCFGIRF